ncbi:MAG: Bro-N domain-containing protein [Saprospiraceae bacterium]|nr:Bro-N domain-containing protein [Saprospiraceae bacterium]
MEKALTPFEGKEIRKIWHNEQWYFSVVDVIEVLTDSPKPKTYWAMMKKREAQPFTFCEPLKLKASDGRNRLTDCANTEGVLRIVMSVPSPKAEPLKLWLAEQGKRAIEETENPELVYDRMAEIYRAKGYDEKWIKERVQTIKTRNKLTDEWKARGVKEGQEYSILTATIAKGTFGLTPSEHSELKGLDNQNLRDHMTDLELIFTALSEEITRQITINDNAQGFNQNHEAAAYGGSIAQTARLRLENEKGIKVVSSQNFLELTGNDKIDELPPSDEK